MPNIKHHLTDKLLLAYATGALPEAFNLVIATHVSMCDECRASLESIEAVGGALLSDAPVAAMDASALDRALARVAESTPIMDASPSAKSGVLPPPLRDYVGGDLEAVRWRGFGIGVRQAVLKTSKRATVRLLHIPAGQSVPDHGHRGTELTLVLQGAFRDDQDRFARGDIEIADETHQHTPVAEEGEDCICLAATDAPLRFTGLLPRVAQRVLGI